MLHANSTHSVQGSPAVLPLLLSSLSSQVMKAKISVVAVVAGKAKVFGRKTVAAVLPTIVDKLGDAKVRGVRVWEGVWVG